MLNECRRQYADDDIELLRIQEFENTYEACKEYRAIFWYTRPCFLYRLLNKAFRTEQMCEIYKFRYFIRDLHAELQHLYSPFIQSLTAYKATLVVYRGQFLHAFEVERLKRSIGKLISMNSFISTTINRELALIYAGNGSESPQKESVLFKIKIHLKSTKPFANIEQFSCLKDENEILLSAGAVFRVVSVEEIMNSTHKNTVWNVELALESDVILNVLARFTNEYDLSLSPLLALKDFMKQVNNAELAKEYYAILLKELPTAHIEYAEALSTVSQRLEDEDDFEQALDPLERAINTYQTLTQDDLIYITLYERLSNLYSNLLRWNDALNSSNQALEFALRVFPEDEQRVQQIRQTIATLERSRFQSTARDPER
ncbi:unnamed protein product [Didymodactylos carnosus]|uniref:NAD(P)(+)--arginine ADP-ribosyltransferase n=1 Tax=Didymodactylos carnosus TaxID=1234261 RepID=A0A815GHK0_9BILA|nr:unnamed protein product [Didymodactylos carnosus]CAF1338377.1 unnamed protein product [Didymodactylos carnosus]CAF3533785.1 unnamed protein product [Didymodactylos carnosus]CAF4197261.1 unnamed protein product [Didymodactylos carnosus]